MTESPSMHPGEAGPNDRGIEDSGRSRDEMRATWLGPVDYGTALGLQRSVVEVRKSNAVPDTLLFLEHPHVITMGRRAPASHVLTALDELEASGVEVHETDRGGEATYHGPGQLVGYPIIDVRAAGLGPVTYVRMLERSIGETLAEFGVTAHVVDGETGVWVGGVPNEKRRSEVNPAGKKIAAIGVRITGGVSMHGFALNVSTDTSYFRHIIPCGMPRLEISTVEAETGKTVSVLDCARVMADRLAANLQRALVWTERVEHTVHSTN
jgi:lipoyl(octanoyl) transferase